MAKTEQLDNAGQRVFAIPELLEIILLHLLDDELQSERRPMAVRHNCRLFRQVLGTAVVSHHFHAAIKDSVRLRRRLFLSPDHASGRAWRYESDSTLPTQLEQFYGHEVCGVLPPYLNPFVEVELSDFPYRFWNLPARENEHKHCAFFIVSRDGLKRYLKKHGSSTVVSQMLLSQPPCYEMECVVFEDRDETRDYVGRTAEIENPRIVSKSGLTIGHICSELQRMFHRHHDIARIKLTTV